MTPRRSRTIHRALLAIALGAVLSSCGLANSAGPTSTPSGTARAGTPSGSARAGMPSGSADTGTPSGSAPGGGSHSSHPVTSSTATATGTTVPNVDSQPVQEAMQNLMQAGLAVGIQKDEPNLYVPNMSVITTDPAVGSPEPTGFVVNLLVSTGPSSCSNCRGFLFPMPDVVGQSLTQAKTTLAEHALSLQTYSFQESPAPQGEVIQSTPSPGTPMTVKFGVALIISSGPSSPSSPSSVSPSTPSSSVPPSTSSPSISPAVSSS